MNQHRGFSLIELLVVISIIAILASMLLPAVSLVKSSAQSSACASNQRQILLAIVAYSGEQDGMLPYSYGPTTVTNSPTPWCVNERLGQYLGITSSSVPWNAALGSSDIRLLQGPWKVLRCPTNVKYPAGCSYGLSHRYACDVTDTSAGNISYPPKPQSAFPNQSMRPVVADVPSECRWAGMWVTPIEVFGNGNSDLPAGWSYPRPQAPNYVVMRHRSTCNIGFLDGHARSSPNMVIEDQAQTIVLRGSATW